MLIDWFTVFAQVLNFLVLAWLLKRFLYHPILNAIDAREKRIADEIANAKEKMLVAESLREEYEKKNADFDKQGTDQLNQVIKDAKTERERLFNEVRQESEEYRDKLQSVVRSEHENFERELSQLARDEVYAIARKALEDLGGLSLEARMVEVFIDRLRQLDDAQMQSIKSEFQAQDILTVHSAFTLSEEQCSLIENVLKDILGEKPVRFVVDEHLVSGIAIRASGKEISWNIAEYLNSLASHVDTVLGKSGKIKEAEQS